jgi:hypothetical protein
MRREVRRLKEKAIASLVLSIELFNRPHAGGRVDGVLLHADHTFELLLKAVIRHRGGEIREPGEAHTIGFKVGGALPASARCPWLNPSRLAIYRRLCP